MEIQDVPFHRLLGITRTADQEAAGLELPDAPEHTNHLGTVHASAQFALAEACSGTLLLDRFADLAEAVLPVVRRAEVRYRRPAVGRLQARAALDPGSEARFRADLQSRGRALLDVAVTVVDGNGTLILTATVQWFVRRRPAASR
jgi:acyl-coenzyme A thioesterase PaaI-like protein